MFSSTQSVCLLLAFVFLSSGALQAKPASTAPGKYKDWGGQVAVVEILQSFHLRDYGMIEILPPDVSAIAIPNDHSHDAMRQTLTDSARIIADEIDSGIPNRMKINAEPLLGGMAPGPRSMKLSLKFVEMDPGSRSTRNFSFGNSGKAHVTLTGELVDTATNKPLLRFTTHNDDGSHGDYEKVLQENLEHAIDRVTRLFKAFYP